MRFQKSASLILCAFLSIGAFFSLFAQNTNSYLGPNAPIPGNPHLVRVQILIYDSIESGGLSIESVDFHGESIPLKPRDIHGFRGQGTFQIKPGTYKLKWKVQRDKIIWPRIIPHEESVKIDPRDLWLQITIQGEKAMIT